MSTINIGIAGLGTVGRGVFKILSEKRALLSQRGSGAALEVVAVSANNRARDRGIDISRVKWFDNPLKMAEDPNIHVVVELIGGADGIAYELCKSALLAKKHVVTANKALIATHGVELAAMAEQNGVTLAFEASVAGGIPVIKTLKEALAANRISRICGILNGTCNYILTCMQFEHKAFAVALKEAQDLGYAEADPSFDVDGVDAAHKICILSAIAFGGEVDVKNIHIEGIRNITTQDFEYAAALGYTIRLLAIAQNNGDTIEQRVHPTLVPLSSPLASTTGVTNAVELACDSAGSIFLQGAGAGEQPTASSVVSDLVDIASKRSAPAFGVQVEHLSSQHFGTMEEYNGAYYVRFAVNDKPGVLASITSALSASNIGVREVLQKAEAKDRSAQVAVITHPASEKSIQQALKGIAGMDYMLEPPHPIRIAA